MGRDDHDTRPLVEAMPRKAIDDDRPTELYDGRDLAASREQLITGSTVAEMMANEEHNLSSALSKLMARARSDLPAAEIDPRTTLLLRHDFEFDRRVGYHLNLKVFDGGGRCVEVSAALDQDGRAIRRGSLISKLIDI